MKEQNIIISPKTKILQLIETYPALENTLINYVPVFEKLKNPSLRKTIAKVATLQQAATIGNVNVEKLINTLRKEVGHELMDSNENTEYNTQQPSWYHSSKVKASFDIRPLLNAGEQPIHQVISDLSELKSKEIFKVIAPFIPAPLIDKAASLKFKHWIDKKNEQLFYIFFYQQ